MARFVALELAQDAACQSLRIARGVRNTALADQIRRAAASVALNLAEADGRDGKDRQYHYRVAYASARETSTGLRLAQASENLPVEPIDDALALLDRVQAMTWRLAHPRP